MIGLFLINVLLAVSWGAVSGSFSEVNLLFGFMLGAAALYLIRDQIDTRGYFVRIRQVVALIFLFLQQLALSAWRVAVLVTKLDIRIKPGFFAFPLTVTRDFEITLLANLITLTPGTLSVDVSDDRKTLFIHAIDVPDVDAAVSDIRNGFEKQILETCR